MTIRSRIAPTPSGYLHLGNAVNFLRVWLMTRAAGGCLRLRIDDADNARSRPEFVEDIFAQLDWLGISWDEGPSGPDDFHRHHSQLLRLARYREVLAQLREKAHLFTCTCSRREILKQAPDGLYPGTCRRHRQAAGSGLIRIHVPAGTCIPVGGLTVPLCEFMGDFVLWRRDDLPAYQLASLADDIDQGVNLIIRGEDLLDSTAAQLFLARALDAGGFLAASFVHHPLITGGEGRKLSKSDGALSLRVMREAGFGVDEVYRATARELGIAAEWVSSLEDLLAGYRAAVTPKGGCSSKKQEPAHALAGR